MSQKYQLEHVISKGSAVTQISKFRYQNNSRQLTNDHVVVEQPMQIRLFWQQDNIDKEQVFSITMRTPGDDEALILGLLLSEGVITHYQQVDHIALEADDDNSNLWEVRLINDYLPTINTLERYQVTYSSCGLCGTTSLKSLELKNPPQLNNDRGWLSISDVYEMPEIMKQQQRVFQQTGGCHAAALFDVQGRFISLYEDIGRHNAVDKLLGDKLKNEKFKSQPCCVVVSGRLSFEIVQKAVMSGISVLISVGSPSDLAISAAKRFDLTLICFVKDNSFNVYHGQWRLSPEAS
ncbi:MAG: FdhD protein [Alteromonadaceae bacterium]|jgi:FdhD protein